jgi:hypothetical protein
MLRLIKTWLASSMRWTSTAAKPQPDVPVALEGLNLPASQVLMGGDRAAYEGPAVPGSHGHTVVANVALDNRFPACISSVLT